ncbi:MAG TPA: NAD regulator [Pseudorhodoplanes sp.]|nr:NAD regulator [Pseudorhodoplanes sp.]HWV52390.1 NAD regulator [Pseudorhodoplanes sp.]
MSRLTPIEIGLTTAIVAVTDEEPRVLVAGETGQKDEPAGLPSGAFDPLSHRTFEIGLREWVTAQTALDIGYVEQLYTFGDRGRHARAGDTDPHVVSVGYLALTREPENVQGLRKTGASFQPWYRFFPWEDWRNGRPPIIDDAILPPLAKWAHGAPGRNERLRLCFGGGNTSSSDGRVWDEEKVLERYELLYEAGLIEEACRDGRVAQVHGRLGESMRLDHRRILATAIARLRGKLKYRPVVFELMPAEFTLTELQRTVEAISGRHLHKQNFRRLVEGTELVEPTGEVATATGGRPAALFRFRREVMQERHAPGLRLGVRR